jgi:hypothetical protein
MLLRLKTEIASWGISSSGFCPFTAKIIRTENKVARVFILVFYAVCKTHIFTQKYK